MVCPAVLWLALSEARRLFKLVSKQGGAINYSQFVKLLAVGNKE